MSMRTLFATTAFAALAACTAATTAPPPAVDTAAIAAAIRAEETQWNADWVARDADRIVGHYAPNATLIVPGIPTMTGVDAIRAGASAGPLSDPGFAITFSPTDVIVAASGDVAVSHGTYQEHDTNPRTHRVDVTQGSYVIVYQKEADGSWKATVDISSPQPAAPAAPAPH